MKVFSLILSFTLCIFCRTIYAQEQYSFDHTNFGYVLRDVVEDGLVKYNKLAQNPKNLTNYLDQVASLSSADLERMSSHEQIAFYINAYNAYTLQSIIDKYPVKSIRDIWGVWKWKKHVVAGNTVTLNSIIHDIVQRKYDEPRVHFALVRASRSCPKLHEQPYTGPQLDAQLKAQALNFINDPTRNYYNREENILYISSIFKWFSQDFGDLYAYLTQYLSGQTQRQFPKGLPDIRFKKYNWGLNEAIEE